MQNGERVSVLGEVREVILRRSQLDGAGDAGCEWLSCCLSAENLNVLVVGDTDSYPST